MRDQRRGRSPIQSPHMHHRFGLLGPVLVRLDDGRYARLSGRQRAVLATLLLNPSTVVSRDRLEAAVWDDPPASAVANLQTYNQGTAVANPSTADAASLSAALRAQVGA